MYIVVAKGKKAPKKDKKVGKVGDGATTFQCIAGPATFTGLGFEEAGLSRIGLLAPATENLHAANVRLERSFAGRQDQVRRPIRHSIDLRKTREGNFILKRALAETSPRPQGCGRGQSGRG